MFTLGPRLRRTLVIATSSLAIAVGSAHGAPDETLGSASGADTLTALLIERGLLPAASQNVVRQVRDQASDLVISAMNFLGVRYRRGGSSVQEGFDCSGFTRYIFEHSVGLVLPRRAQEQATAAGLASVGRDELKPGDLVFFNTLRRTFSHVGIYMGDGKFIHSPKPGSAVRIEDMREAYWAQRYNGARRANLQGNGLNPAEFLRSIPAAFVGSPQDNP